MNANPMGNQGRRKSGHRRPERKDDEFDQKMIDIARVTRVMAGGKRMSFRACVVIGDRKGRVGVGIRKGADVAVAINKAVTAAKKELIKVVTINDTVPAEIVYKYKAARLFIKPAKPGTGVIAGGAIRAVFELAGVKNVVAKMLGSKSKINNVRAAIMALDRMKGEEQLKALRSK
ncbi:MAG: 30S ribosomal protein S5 [Patescibacteria group bacterium]